MYAIICLVLYIPGGWLADRFSLKKIMITAMSANAILAVAIAFKFTWPVALIVWGLCAFTSGGAFWAALIKGVGLSGTSEEQGKIWGMYEFGDALLGLIVSYINLWVLAKFEATLGIRSVFYSISVISLIAVILLIKFFSDTEGVSDNNYEKANFKEVLGVFKLPVIWFVALIIMCNYLVFAGMTYFTPYLTDVLGLGIVAGTALVIFRSNGIRMLAGPSFGYIADKKRSPLKAINLGMLLTAILIGIFIVLPARTAPVVLILIFFLATFSSSAFRFSSSTFFFSSAAQSRGLHHAEPVVAASLLCLAGPPSVGKAWSDFISCSSFFRSASRLSASRCCCRACARCWDQIQIVGKILNRLSHFRFASIKEP